jgi:hypothetical protein
MLIIVVAQKSSLCSQGNNELLFILSFKLHSFTFLSELRSEQLLRANTCVLGFLGVPR